MANPAVQNGARTRIPIPDEDPYSLAGSGGGSGGSSGSSGKPSRERPPKLPPRDTDSRTGRREAVSSAERRGMGEEREGRGVRTWGGDYIGWRDNAIKL